MCKTRMKGKYQLAVIRGDGVGPEVMKECLKVLKALEQVTELSFKFIEAPAGAQSYREEGTALPEETLKICGEADGIIKAPVGTPDLPPGIVEGAVIMGLRQRLDLYVNLRPIKLYPELNEASPLKNENILKGVDFVIVRENTESLYKGHGGISQDVATDVMIYTRHGVERILRYAFDLAMKRREKVTSVDKANIIYCSRFWRACFEEMAKRYPQVESQSVYVDAFSQWIIRDPGRFDVVVVDNMFGDIVSDEAGEIVGSLGMLYSVNYNPETGCCMAEPGHGSAPDIAGKNLVNPIAMILSAKLMLDCLQEKEAADIIGQAVETVISKGYRTVDIAPTGWRYVGTEEMGDAIVKEVQSLQ
ncbi:MAG: 3-isopropylmalate dehydrogenase [Nitrososphaeria archaeon]|nr:3-isopropylmalate dehydrogenase [Nitrososphaeria archaeon]